MSGTVPAEDEISVIFVRKFFRRTHATGVWHFPHL